MPTNIKTPDKHPTEGDIDRHAFSATAIKLDGEGHLPTRIPLFVTGDWPNSIKGKFKVTLADLKQMKANFDAGIGFPTDDASTGLAIDLAHDYVHEAAGWIKGLELQADPSDDTKGVLYANPVQWTDIGQKAITGGQYKCISPMGSFGTHDGEAQMYANPVDLTDQRPNVLEGAGLTNIPFLRGMKPIRASAEKDLQNANATVIYVYDEQKKESDMQLDALRVKEREALSVPELDFLEEKKAELSADELTKFKLEATTTEDDKDQLSDEDKQTLAALKAGNKKLVDGTAEVVEKTRLDKLESTIDGYRKKDVAAIMAKHVKRGAVKQDQVKEDQTDFWSKQLLGASTDEARQSVEVALNALPGNDLLAREIGTSEDIAAGSTAREQLHVLAKAKVAAAAKDGKEMLYADALKQVYKDNADLKQQDLVEQTGGK